VDGEGSMDIRSGIDRLAELLAVTAEMTDMIKMVMGNKYGRERVVRELPLGKVSLEAAQTDASVDEHAIVAVTQIVAVAAASA